MPSILGANSASGAFEVANSLRFNDGDSPALTRSLGTTTLTTKGTFSFWVKRGQLGTAQIIYSNEVADDNNRAFIQFEDDDTFRIKDTVSGSNTTHYATTQKFRDVGAWYHMVVALDSTEAGGNRIRVYKNGTRIPDANFGTSTEPNQNSDFKLLTGGQTNKNHIGKIHGGANHFDGYLAEFVYCDGQVLDASSFGEFDGDSPVWKPKSVSGLTMGDQGFYLDFEDSSALGNDKAGSNNFGTVTNLAATDQSTDTCTNNYITMNPNNATLGSVTLSEGNLKASLKGNYQVFGTINLTSGKWYWEQKIEGSSLFVSVADGNRATVNTGTGLLNRDYAWAYRSDGVRQHENTTSSYGDSFTTNDIIGVALDMDNGFIYFSKNGTFQNSGDPTSGATGTGAAYSSLHTDAAAPDGLTPCLGQYGGDQITSWNFGSPSYSISSGNSDGNGYGNFEYAVPSGYYAINTKNLAEYG
jgi:hypothetical protein